MPEMHQGILMGRRVLVSAWKTQSLWSAPEHKVTLQAQKTAGKPGVHLEAHPSAFVFDIQLSNHKQKQTHKGSFFGIIY